MKTPFTIAIHGEWGSGKTTLIHQIKKELDKKIENTHNKLKFRIVEFDAWEYERTDIVAALLQKIQRECEGKSKKSTQFAEAIGSFVLDAALRKSIGISKKEVNEHFAKFTEHVETIREIVAKVIQNKRLVVLIDDLDRCHIDNVLDMLEAIKMFLSVEHVIFVVAVDMNKIERAWELRYKSETGLIEGREHVEKIFQLKLSLPPKTDEQMKKYLQKLAKSFANYDLEYFVKSCPGNNPRKIKRMLNLLYFILYNFEVPGKNQKEKNVNFDIHFQTLVTWIAITTNHPEIAKKIIHFPSSLIVASAICNKVNILDKLKSMKNEIITRDPSGHAKTLSLRFDQCPDKVMEILEDIVTKDEKAFMTLKRFALQREITFDHALYNAEGWGTDTEYGENSKYAHTLEIVQSIIRTSGLIGI